MFLSFIDQIYLHHLCLFFNIDDMIIKAFGLTPNLHKILHKAAQSSAYVILGAAKYR